MQKLKNEARSKFVGSYKKKCTQEDYYEPTFPHYRNTTIGWSWQINQ